MSKLLVVATEEIGFHLRQWSFYLTLILLPLMFAALGAVPRLRQAANVAPLPEVETIINMPAAELDGVIGLVDQAGLVTTIPPQLADHVQRYATKAAADRALLAEEIDSYYVLAADYLAHGRVIHYSQTPQLLAETDGALRELLRLNLLARLNNPSLAARLDQPVTFVRDGPPPPVMRFISPDFDLQRLASAGLVIFLFIVLLNNGGSLLLRALQREVRARVLEVMIVNTTPLELIGGKLLGLTALVLLQGGLTLLAGLLVYGENPDGSGPSALPASALALSLPFLLLGFLAYCGGLMAVAALWPDFKESGALMGGLQLIAMTPLLGTLFILPQPDSPLSFFFSVLPLTSHLLMPFRLLLGPVPAWQWLVGVVILAAWALLWLWLSVRLFRLHSLLTGRSISLRLLRQALWA